MWTDFSFEGIKKGIWVAAWLGILFAGLGTVMAEDYPLKTADIPIRDPFVVTDQDAGVYYLYAQTRNRMRKSAPGVEVYTSRDLENWTQPQTVLTVPPEWNAQLVWAPEVHRYNGAYYIFVTLTYENLLDQPAPVEGNWPPMQRRGTWVFKADSPLGPFLPLKKDAHTPSDWMALDGTLWVEDGTPYMIFCHEWVQLVDGTIDVVELKKDLSDTVGEPQKLFSASDVSDSQVGPFAGRITDGPFLYRSPKSGALFMIWSTFHSGKYGTLVVRSESGKLAGPWKEHTPLYMKDGGHGMIFQTLDGSWKMAIHQPNVDPQERLHVLNWIDDGKTITCTE